MSNETVGYRNRYGSVETEGLVDGAAYHASVDYSQTYTLAEVSRYGGKISRIRFIGDRVPRVGAVLDVSYVHAVMPGGKIVPVHPGTPTLMPKWTLKRHLVEWAQAEGVYAKGLGLLDEGNWSTCY